MARILLADDDAGTRDMVSRALQLDGHVVVTAEDGAEAEATMAVEAPFDVIVTDIQMPGVDGISLTMRAVSRNVALRVVLMSAHADVLERARTLVPPTVRLLSKPFTIASIRDEVRAAMAS